MPERDLGRQFCDVVMKGGITSGVVYPTAVRELARAYRLRSIGGASAGAIAAVAAAAAEYRRQRGGGEAGFERLDGLPAELGRQVGEEGSSRAPRHSALFHLFAPTPLSRPVMDVLLGMLNRRSVAARAGFGIVSLLRSFPLSTGLGLLVWLLALAPVVRGCGAGACSGGPLPCVAGALGVTAAALAITASALGVVLGWALWRSGRRFGRIMAEQDFGLCTGMGEPGGGTVRPPALTEWLHALVQDVGGLPAGRPLTFGDLRRTTFAETPGRDGIVLRTVTTCLTLGRPFSLPLEHRFYFDPVELRRYLPAPVVAWMEAHPWTAGSAADRRDDEAAAGHEESGRSRPLLPMPEPDDFPVLLQARMSLSFPILLSAIPLHRVTWEPSEVGKGFHPRVERHCFTDGGVCSNLPIHLFDSPLPEWPTFAINLRDDLPAGATPAERVYAPPRYEEDEDGRTVRRGHYLRDRYDVSTAVSFLVAIVDTMQNWRDTLQRDAAGFKERVYTVRHTREEGGLNLDMPEGAILTLARSGAQVAEAIVADYHRPADAPVRDAWLRHRWVRLRLLLPVLQEFLAKLDVATGASPNQPAVRELLLAAPPVMGRSFELAGKDRLAAWELFEAVSGASAALGSADVHFEDTSPRPNGTLRVTPEF